VIGDILLIKGMPGGVNAGHNRRTTIYATKHRLQNKNIKPDGD